MPLPSLRDQFALAKRGSLRQLNDQFVEIAKAANAGIMALEPRPAGVVRTVDGIIGAPEEAVRPDGLIVYNYQRLDFIVAFAIDTLRSLSPKKTGAYVEAHTIYVNGSVARPPYVISATDEVHIANPERYARKIEVGHMHMTVPGTDHVYQQAEQIVSREYGSLVRVEFSFVALPGAGVLAGRFSRGKQAQSRKRLQKDTRRGATPMFPALVFSLR